MLRLTRTLPLLLAASLFAAGPATAATDQGAPGTTDEVRLAAGETLSYPQALSRGGRRYVGGVTYTVVDATVEELTDLLSDMSAYVEVLPHARNARIVGTLGADRLVEIRQGTSFVEAAYTLRMRPDDDRRRVRFWLDRSRHHDIEDAWGYFRVEPMAPASDGTPRVLLAYGIMVDLGPGLMRDFFESRIQASMLTVPDRLRQYAQARFRGRRRA